KCSGLFLFWAQSNLFSFFDQESPLPSVGGIPLVKHHLAALASIFPLFTTSIPEGREHIIHTPKDHAGSSRHVPTRPVAAAPDYKGSPTHLDPGEIAAVTLDPDFTSTRILCREISCITHHFGKAAS